MYIQIPETKIPINLLTLTTGNILDLNLKVIIDEPTLMGYKCMVCETGTGNLQSSLPNSSKTDELNAA